MSAQYMTIFYSICGIIVAWMFFRMWRKSRRTTPTAAQSTVRPEIQQIRTEAISKATVASTPTHVVADPAHASTPAPTAARPTYVTSGASYRSADETNTSSWEGRRLLETVGMIPRSTNTMPRILPAEVPGVDDSDRVFGSTLNPAFAAMLPESAERNEQVRKDLNAAGFYNPHAIENLAASRYALIMLSIILFGSLVLVVPPRLEPFVVACCLLAPLLAWAFPALYVRSKAKARKQEIERAMPDLLDMLNMCVGQGLTVPASLQRIGRDFRPVYPALSQELAIVNEQAKISTMQTALENFSHRIDVPEVHSLTSLLIQTERMGTSISQALTTYSDTMRESQRQQADEKGNRATFRLLFPTVLCLMPAVYLFLLGPAISELQKFFYGGGADSLNSGSQIVQRLNATRGRGGRNNGQAGARPISNR